MLSEDLSFDTLAQQYGVNRCDYDRDLDYAVEVLFDPDSQKSIDGSFLPLPLPSKVPGQVPSSESQQMHFSAADDSLACHFNFDRAEELGLLASTDPQSHMETSGGSRHCPETTPTTYSKLAGLSPEKSSNSIVLDDRSESMGAGSGISQRTGSMAASTEMVVEPVPGRKVKLVPVIALPDLYRTAFAFPFFNAAQSICYPTMLESDKNVVLSAPTGAGKTVIFELALIRMLSREPANSKAVYLAPTKALCAERTRDWSRRFSQLGFGITELTGDSIHGLHVARKSRIIVTTPEKWDSLTRKWSEQQTMLSTIRLLLIDEVHILNEPGRGARLEVVVTRTKLHGHRVRFVAVSATIPNLEDVGLWIGCGDKNTLGAPENARQHQNDFSVEHDTKINRTDPKVQDTDVNKDNAIVFRFGEEFRPCPLSKFVYGFPKAKDEFSFQSYLNYKLYDIIQTHAAGRPCLIFVATRRSTVQAATTLADTMKKLEEEGKEAFGPQTQRYKQRRFPETFDDADLQNLSQRWGIGFHHAGLSQNDRRKVEQAFTDERLSLLCCTTTLATGVNLPAHCVIVRGTKQFDGQWNEIADLDLIQMMGRAGRPQFDRSGVAVVMCEDTAQQKYRDLVSGSRDMESGLAASLVEHVNAEIGLRGRTSRNAMEQWIRQSFMWTRILKNPTHYLSKDEGICLDRNEDISRHLCRKAINSLQETSLVLSKEETGELASTEYGDIMSRFFIRHGTMLALMNLGQGSGTRAILEAISAAEEFESLRIRQGERAYLQALRTHSEIRFPPKQLSSVKDKVFLLIQATLSAVSLTQLPKAAAGNEHSPYSDVRMIFQHAPRIVKAVMDIAILRRDGNACKAALDLARSISARAWDGSPAMLRQIEQVGEKSIKALANAGLGTWLSLANSTPARIEMILNRNPPFGSNVIKAAQSVPRIGVEVLQKPCPPRLSSAVPSEGIVVLLKIAVKIENRSTCMMRSKSSKLPLSACILSLTSEHDYIDFRRMPLWRLDKGKSFTLRCHLPNLRTRVLVYAACDEVAGTLILADLLPADMQSDSHRTKLVRAKAPDNSLIGLVQSVHNASLPEASSLEPGCQATSSVATPTKKCKHKCRGRCRHACCQREADLGGDSSNLEVSRQSSVDDPGHEGSLLQRINTLTGVGSGCESEGLPSLILPRKRTAGPVTSSGELEIDLFIPSNAKKSKSFIEIQQCHRTAGESSDSPFLDARSVVDLTEPVSPSGEEACRISPSPSKKNQPPQSRFVRGLAQPDWLSCTAKGDSHL